MKIFQRKNKNVKELHPFIITILMRIKNMLKLCADWLQRKTNTFSTGKQKIILILFCALFISESLFVIHQSFKKGNKDFYFVTPIRTIPLLKQEVFQPVISEKELSRMYGFKIYLDSLKSTLNGKIKLDSFLSVHPHLLDTINYLENIYYEQQTNRK